MQKPNISKVYNDLKRATVKHSPEILTGFGIAGMVTTTVLAVKATPKALLLIENEKREQNRILREEALAQHKDAIPILDRLKPVDVIKVAWKPYIPAAITGTVSIACLIGASFVNARRNAALTAAYTLSESALKDYRSKVVETIGEKKEQTIRDAVAKENVEKDPVNSKEVIITGKGETLCYDAISGRYFMSDIDKIKKAENLLNRNMRDEMYVSLNDFYYEIGLPSIKLGNDLGWNIDNGYIDLHFSSQLAEDGRPCLVIDYLYGPRYDYRNPM